MSYGFEDAIEGVKGARASFHKHIDGITPEQWAWKAYPGCKSIGETVAHLIWGDRAVLHGIQSNEQPDYSTVPENHPSELQTDLIEQLHQSHQELVQYLTETYASSPLDTEISFYGHQTKIGTALGYALTEDGYHTGQVAYIRMATDPTWDYYTNIYG